jgi:hypothetical protein
MRYRMNAKVVGPKGQELGRVSYTVRAPNKRSARAKIDRLLKAHKVKKARRNVEMGFWDATGFHPIRASEDYSAGRAGERFREATRHTKMVRRARRRK